MPPRATSASEASFSEGRGQPCPGPWTGRAGAGKAGARPGRRRMEASGEAGGPRCQQAAETGRGRRPRSQGPVPGSAGESLPRALAPVGEGLPGDSMGMCVGTQRRERDGPEWERNHLK